jgi:hypothetical protein
LQILCPLEINVGAGLLAKASAAAPHDYQDFLAFSYSGMTFGIAACNEAIRLDDAG